MQTGVVESKNCWLLDDVAMNKGSHGQTAAEAELLQMHRICARTVVSHSDSQTMMTQLCWRN